MNSVISFIIILLIILGIGELFLLVHKWYVKLEAKRFTLELKKIARISGKDKDSEEIDYRKNYAKATDIIFIISLLIGEIISFSIVGNQKSFLEYMKTTLLYGMVPFFIYLNIRIFYLKTIRIKKQIKEH